MQLYQVVRKVVPGGVIKDANDPDVIVDIIPGLAQVVWEGKSRREADRQLKMAEGIKAPKGSKCRIRNCKTREWINF